MKKLIGFLITIAILGALVYLIGFKYEVKIYRIDGSSMNPTFKNGELVVSIKADKLKRKDIVVYNYNNSKVIKRIIALPNESIEIRNDGKVYINDSVLEEDGYVVSKTNKGELSYPIKLPENEYFVIGDNRLDSYDSRYVKVGNIPRNKIQGKIIFSINTFRIFK